MSTHIIRFKAICMMAVSAILTASVVLSVMLAAGCGGNGNDGGGTPGASGKASETRQPLDNSSNPASETAAADDVAAADGAAATESAPKADNAAATDGAATADNAAATDNTITSGGIATADSAAEAIASAIADARLLAASYDYDRAIAKLESIKTNAAASGEAAVSGEAEKPLTETIDEIIAEIAAAKATLEEADVTAIPHIFFHSLIVDPSLAFHNDKARAEDYNISMTTVDEFNLIIQQMYDRGYVLVSLHQMAQYTEGADGSGRMTAGKIMLPPGKKPIVLSIDDMSYYAYMMTDGFATKLVIGPDGNLTNEMEKNDGTTVYGSYDVVPLLNDFIKKHPDFSYQGAKGAIALTGYDGVFGYRTDQDYYLKEHLLYEQAEWLKKHPDFDYEKDLADAKVIAQALRDDGWELASHSWGHRDMQKNSMEKFVTDMEKWIDRVESIIGDTDILIYPFGSDVETETGSAYTMDNEKYAWLHDHGFHYFCTVNSTQPSVQIGDQYLRQGRINADGYMMYHFPEKLMPYFDVDSVFDSKRPLPVLEY